MIGVDTSVLVRYLVGTPEAQARRAARLVDGEAELGISLVALAECAHVLRTQYGVSQSDVLDSLIGFVQRENVTVLGMRTEILVEHLVRARGMTRPAHTGRHDRSLHGGCRCAPARHLRPRPASLRDRHAGPLKA